MGQQNPAFPPGYNPAFPTASGMFQPVPNAGFPAGQYPAGQFPAPMNPAMVPNAPSGGMPYGAPGAHAYPMAPGGVHPGQCYPSSKGDHHKGKHKGEHKGKHKDHHKDLHPGGFYPGPGMVVGGHGHKKDKKMKKMKKGHKHGHKGHGKVRFGSR